MKKPRHPTTGTWRGDAEALLAMGAKEIDATTVRGLLGEDITPDDRPTVTLRFENEDAKREFMSDLSDGSGENMCSLEWPQDTDFDDCHLFDVVVFDEEE